MLGLDIQWYTKQALCPHGAFPLLVTMHVKQIVTKINIKLQVAMSVVKEKGRGPEAQSRGSISASLRK